jgi:hypothetical protein
MLATLAPLRPLRLPPEIYRPTLASRSPDLSVSPAVQLGPVHRAQLILLDGSAAGVDTAGQRGCLGLAISNVAARIVAARPEFDGLRFVDHQLRSAVARNWRNRDTALSSSFASILRSSARVNMAVISSSNHCRSRSSKAMKCAGLKLSDNFDSNVSVAIGLQAVVVRGRRAPPYSSRLSSAISGSSPGAGGSRMTSSVRISSGVDSGARRSAASVSLLATTSSRATKSSDRVTMSTSSDWPWAAFRFGLDGDFFDADFCAAGFVLAGLFAAGFFGADFMLTGFLAASAVVCLFILVVP